MTMLVVAAWEPELERFRDLVPPGLNLVLGGVGIGLVDAAIGTTRLLAAHRPASLLLLGTCGASPGSGLGIGDVISATEISLVDPATSEGRAALPWDPRPIPATALPGARPATVATTLGITTDDALARVLARNAMTEHLEAYAVARAAEQAAIPCSVLLGVTNLVGAEGRAQWRANHVAVSARVAEVAHAALRTSTTARSPG